MGLGFGSGLGLGLGLGLGPGPGPGLGLGARATLRRALSSDRKPRRRGADGGEFTALLEGSAEDREARLLARQQATARAIERAMHALAAEAPPAPSDAQLADPLRMAAYMEALSAHASRQQEALQSHEAEV